ncbi:MAG: YdcF family protein [Verrucomicrobiales bacterium]|nr:YdcF family protein [Verrucomicrobiales bacterium]
MVSEILRTLLQLSEPVGIIWIGLLLLTLRPLRRRPRRIDGLAGALWLLWSVVTCSPLAGMLVGRLEAPWTSVRLADLPECDAIISLGGGVEPLPLEPAGIHLKDAGDRLTATLTAARARPAAPVVFGGGHYVSHDGRQLPAADALRDWLEASGLVTQPVFSLGLCGDTHDEAVRTAALCEEQGWKRVMLVTSAYHMARSKAVFETAGVTVEPLPCNFMSPANRLIGARGRLSLPGNGGLNLYAFWLHEVVGERVYRWRGWIR